MRIHSTGIYQTAVPNITVAIGSTRELLPSEILSADSTDYLLGGSLTLRNGRIDKLQFDEGYCLASAYPGNTNQDNFAFCYFNLDHLGSVRQVIRAVGSSLGNVVQSMNYYPFGAQFCDGSTDSDVQPRRYNFSIEREKRKLACFSEREKNRPKVNGKELDKMHGLNTYDYGARQYNPVTARWDRVDPLCEKYYDVSPYVYCANNPVRYVTPDTNSKTLNINEEIVKELESSEGFDADICLILTAVTILHESAHYGDDLAGNPEGEKREDGDEFEKRAYGKVITKSNVKKYLSDFYHKSQIENKNVNKEKR